MVELRRVLPMVLAVFGAVFLVFIGTQLNNSTIDRMLREMPEIKCQVPNIAKTDIDWRTADVNILSPQQVVDYLYWTNRSSCRLAHDFGGQRKLTTSGHLMTQWRNMDVRFSHLILQ